MHKNCIIYNTISSHHVYMCVFIIFLPDYVVHKLVLSLGTQFHFSSIY